MRIKKQRIWKPKLFRLGLLLTLGVIAADWGQLLNALENLLYDRRARWCQRFTPPPTDRIVHVDIDDDALAMIGAWPWRREILARILDEISAARPKVIGFDIYFPDSQRIEGVKRDDGSVEWIDNDALFAASIKRAGNVLIPVSLRFASPAPADPLFVKIKHLLTNDLELEPEQVVAVLQHDGMKGEDLPALVRTQMSAARQEAMMARLNEQVAAGVTDLDTLRKKLVPRSVTADINTDASQLLESNYELAMAVHSTARFQIPLPKDVPLAYAPNEEAINIRKFAEAIRYSGFVDLPVSSADGTIRSVPLLVNYRGGALPHMALGMACAMLGADPNNIRCTRDSITIPVPDHEPIVIPARVERSTSLGPVGAIIDVPFFGKSGDGSWLTIYDFPRYQESVGHLKLSILWKLLLRGDSIRRTNSTADRALKFLSTQIDAPPSLDAFLKHVPDLSDTQTRLKVIDDTLKVLAEAGIGDLLKKPDSELDADEKKLVLPTRDLQAVARVNRESERLLAIDRTNLTHELQGKAVFIDWTAVGRTDFYSTSLEPRCPGAVIQGVIVNGILTHELWRRLPHWVTALMTLGVGLLTAMLVALLPPWRALFCTLMVMTAYALINGEVLFDYGNLIVGAAGPLTACGLVWSGLTLTNFITEARERARTRKRFSNYIDPAIVNYYEDHPELAGIAPQRREMTVVFTDLAGFTTISEKLGESTVALLNAYFGKMVPVIRDNRGVVNKFLGDGLMFFYNAPDDNPNHATDAVQTILDMRRVLEGFNDSLKQRGLPLVGMRAGMTTGHMVVGDAGSKAEDAKNNSNDYTVLGDKVNLAARLEGANKVFGSNLLMNQETRDGIGDRFLCRKIGKIQVKGKSEYVMCHEAICTLAEATPEQTAQAGLCTEIVDVFQAGEFDRCVRLCEDLEARFKDADFAEAYRDECDKHLRKAFKGTFAGQIVLSEK